MAMQADELAVRRALKEALEVWPGRVPNVTIYFNALSDLPQPAVLEGVAQLMREWHYAHRPVPGDFRKRAQECVQAKPALREGDDGYLRDAAGRHVVMDEMATREVYRRQLNHVPSGWTDEAMADREALREYYRRRAVEPPAEWTERVMGSLRAATTMPLGDENGMGSGIMSRED